MRAQFNKIGQTFNYAAWTTPGTYSGFLADYTGTRTAPAPTRGFADIARLSACGTASTATTSALTTATTTNGQYHPEDEVFAQWVGRGGVEPVLGPSWDGRLTFMGSRTTGLGGPYAGFGSYAQSC
jgi:hypothetical protein